MRILKSRKRNIKRLMIDPNAERVDFIAPVWIYRFYKLGLQMKKERKLFGRTEIGRFLDGWIDMADSKVGGEFHHQEIGILEVFN